MLKQDIDLLKKELQRIKAQHEGDIKKYQETLMNQIKRVSEDIEKTERNIRKREKTGL